MIAKMIEKITGMKSVTFSSIRALSGKLSKLKPVAAFVDIGLDDSENGLEIVPALRREWPFAPIIVVTSKSRRNG